MALKLVLLGDTSVGKSSLVNRFAVDSFDPHSPNTIGAAFISKEHTSGPRKVKFEIWDTAGQERYKSLTPMYYRNARVALVCFDLSNQEQSFERAQYWVDQLRLSGPAEIAIWMIGTKMDLLNGSHHVIPQITEYCSSHNLQLVETSAKSGSGVFRIFDSIVDSLDDEFFLKQDQKPGDTGQENLLLRIPGKNTGCC